MPIYFGEVLCSVSLQSALHLLLLWTVPVEKLTEHGNYLHDFADSIFFCQNSFVKQKILSV